MPSNGIGFRQSSFFPLCFSLYIKWHQFIGLPASAWNQCHVKVARRISSRPAASVHRAERACGPPRPRCRTRTRTSCGALGDRIRGRPRWALLDLETCREVSGRVIKGLRGAKLGGGNIKILLRLLILSRVFGNAWVVRRKRQHCESVRQYQESMTIMSDTTAVNQAYFK